MALRLQRVRCTASDTSPKLRSCSRSSTADRGGAEPLQARFARGSLHFNVMLQLPLILILLACALAVSHASVTIFLCCAVGFACSLWLLYGFGRGTHPVRLTWLLASGLLLGYCGGDVVGQSLYGLVGQDAIGAIGIDSRYIAYGLMLVFGGCAGLLFTGNFETPLLRDLPAIQFDPKLERFIWLFIALTAAAFLHGDFGYSASPINPTGEKISVLAGICAAGGMALPPLACLGYVQASGFRKFRLGLLTLLSFGALVPVSRRDVFYTALVSAFCILQLSGRKFHMSTLRKVVLGTIAMAAFLVSSLVFFGIRASAVEQSQGSGRQADSGEKVTLAEGLAAARIGVFSDPRALMADMASKLQDRVFVIDYLSLLARGGNAQSPMYGQDALFAMKMGIPDAIYDAFGVSKDPVREIGAEEGVANEHFGLNVTDEANSILTAGVIDFGFVGVIVYPILLCFLVRKELELLRYLFSDRIYLIVIVLVLGTLVQTELELDTYVQLFRNLLLIAIGCAALFSVPAVVRSRRKTIPPLARPINAPFTKA